MRDFLIRPRPIRPEPSSRSDAGSGTGGVTGTPGRKVSGPVPKLKVTAEIVVSVVMAKSEITKVPVPLMNGEK